MHRETGGDGAGDGNRTHAIGLGSRSSTIELHPRSRAILRARIATTQSMGQASPNSEVDSVLDNERRILYIFEPFA